jgi:diguanylate cyclase (GGDEF)-like protein
MDKINSRLLVRSLRNATTYLGAIIIAFIWIGFLWNSQAQRERALQVARKSGANLAHAYAESVQHEVNEIDKTLLLLRIKMLSDPAHFNPRDLAADPRYSSDLAANILVIDADGIATTATPAGRGMGNRVDMHDREQYLTFLADPRDRLYISKPVIGRVLNRWITVFARPILGPGGSFKGVVAISVDPEILTRFYEIIDIGKQGRITLIGDDRVVRAAQGGAQNVLGQTVPASIWSRYMQAESGSFYGSFDSVSRLVSFHRVRGLPLIATVALSERELMASYFEARTINELTACGITTLILLGMVLNARHRASLHVAQGALQASEAKALEKSRELAVTLEHMGQGLMMVDSDSKVAVINHQAIDLLGLPEDFLGGRHSFDDFMTCLWKQGDFGEDGETLEPKVREFVKAGGMGDIGTFERTRPNGTVLEICSVPLPGGGLVRTYTDITERKNSEARVAHMARHDELTGLANRVLFRERIEQAIAQSKRGGHSFAVLLLDLDRFKDINDTLGHAAGDALLKIAAQRLCQSVRETDTVARLGGDEFAIVQTGIAGSADAEVVCRRVLSRISEVYQISEHSVDIGTSIGIAVAPRDGLDADGLLKKADIALYTVKSNGRGGWRFFEPAMEANAQARRALEYDLRKALHADQFELVYQPMIDLASNQVVGLEALLRWNHPQRGIVSPAEFVPVAEEVGLIFEIGQWVLRTACATAVDWPSSVHVSVNLSPAQFKDRKLVETVRNVLTQTCLPPHRLELEITETVILQEDKANLSVLQELRALGVGIALDDFGTGYSSLSHLRSFPFTKIKIDRSFVKDLDKKPDCLAIVRAVADLGKSLNVPTIAEGVETGAQLELVRAVGCKEAQGYLISQPVAARNVASAIGRRELAAERAA